MKPQLKNRINLANKYIKFAIKHNIQAEDYFGGTFPVIMTFKKPIQVSSTGRVVTIEWKDGYDMRPHKEKIYPNKFDGEEELRYTLTAIIRGIKKGAKQDGYTVGHSGQSFSSKKSNPRKRKVKSMDELNKFMHPWFYENFRILSDSNNSSYGETVWISPKLGFKLTRKKRAGTLNPFRWEHSSGATGYGKFLPEAIEQMKKVKSNPRRRKNSALPSKDWQYLGKGSTGVKIYQSTDKSPYRFSWSLYELNNGKWAFSGGLEQRQWSNGGKGYLLATVLRQIAQYDEADGYSFDAYNEDYNNNPRRRKNSYHGRMGKPINPQSKRWTLETFSKKYFGKNYKSVPMRTRKDFWSDFRYAFVGSLTKYIEKDYDNLRNPRRKPRSNGVMGSLWKGSKKAGKAVAKQSKIAGINALILKEKNNLKNILNCAMLLDVSEKEAKSSEAYQDSLRQIDKLKVRLKLAKAQKNPRKNTRRRTRRYALRENDAIPTYKVAMENIKKHLKRKGWSIDYYGEVAAKGNHILFFKPRSIHIGEKLRTKTLSRKEARSMHLPDIRTLSMSELDKTIRYYQQIL